MKLDTRPRVGTMRFIAVALMAKRPRYHVSMRRKGPNQQISRSKVTNYMDHLVSGSERMAIFIKIYEVKCGLLK